MRINQRGFVWLILGLCVMAVPAAVLTQSAGGQNAENKDSAASSDGLMTRFKDHIQVVRLSGMIIDKADHSLFTSSVGSSSNALKELRKALKSKKVKAVLLRVNSPGGTVPMSQEIHEAVVQLKAAGKPVVVSMGDVAASGGYYISCAADKIVANPGTLTGSIGVIINLMNFKALADKVGVEPEVIKSGLFKDIASPYKKMTREERDILLALIMDSYDQFTTAIAEGRKIPIEKVKTIADGRIYSGRQAQKLGLVDELGSYSDALALLQTIAKERYKLKADLAVDEDDDSGILASLMEGRTQLTPPGASSPLDKLIPSQFNPELNKQPLWLMQ
ncbi:MAG: signal peptide peptidase SppA [Candidatus Melainabacteria bacterium]|nr:signal peptide peptidase SppA [Candidatus Melainabacteria bacterium]